MRIALLTDGIHPYVIGGMQKHSFYLAKYLAQNEIYVDLYHFNQSNYDINKLEFFSEEERKYITSVVLEFPESRKFPGHYIFESYKYSKQLFECIKDKIASYDFIIAKGFTAWELIRKKRQGLKCPPIAVKFHGLNMFQKQADFKSYIQSYFFRTPAKYNMRNADYVFSYGGKITEITKRIGISADKILEFPSGITKDWLDNTLNHNETVKFLYVGRYERLKGIEELCKAIKNISGKYKFEFHFVGPIPEQLQLKLPNVKYYGAVTDLMQLRSIYKKCDVLVCVSYSEGMPNVILEAMAQSLTVMATDVGATNILVNKDTGWLIPYCDEKLIEQQLIEIIDTAKDKLQLKKTNAFKHVKEYFMWEVISHKLIGKIKEIVLSGKAKNL